MKYLIVANWKMNPASLPEAKRIYSAVKNGVKNIKKAEVVICPPFQYLPFIQSGAQDLFWEDRGAYTGEISALMLKKMGVKYVILGHSERRKYFKETDSVIQKKIKAAQKHGLKPILCVDKIGQIPKKAKGLIIAYEPLFAIGTSQACSPERAGKMRMAIKRIAGTTTPILYGGSVNSKNAKAYTGQAGFSGLLVGGGSLNAKEFVDIVKNVCYSE